MDEWRTNESQASSQNTTDKPFPSCFYYCEPLALKVFKLTLEVAIALVGVLGNVLVCVVITKRANMKTSMNLYLRNLAITDLGVLLVNFPLAANSVHSTAGWPFGRFLCLYVAPATDMFFGASIWSITVIAIERYKNIISRKVFVKKVESFKRVTLKIVLIWLVSFAVVAVPMYPFMVYTPQNRVCLPDWPTFSDNFTLKAYAVCLAIFWYLLPLGIISITYWKISAQLKQSNMFHKTMHGEDTTKSKLLREEEKQRLKQNKKAQRILTPLVVIFGSAMLPFNVFRIVDSFVTGVGPQMEHFMLILDLCVLGIVINATVDPVVYYICSKEFRLGMNALMRCRKETSRRPQDTITTPKSTTRSVVSAEIGTMAMESPM